MNKFEHFFETIGKDIEGFFENPKVVALGKELATMIPQALSIVAEIGVGSPDASADLAKVNAIATKYVVPTLTEISSDPVDAGNDLLTLGTQILQKKFPDVSFSVAKTAIQNAYQLVESAGVAAPKAA